MKNRANLLRILATFVMCLLLGRFAAAATETDSPSLSNSGNGDIYFFTEASERPANGPGPAEGRHVVTPGQTILVCLKLDAARVPLFQSLEKGAIGYRLVLEDESDPPRVLVVAPGNRLKLMKRDPDGCFSGSYRIPSTIASGIFQVADLLLAYEDQSYYSLRDYLYGFSQVDELEIKNPHSDIHSPQLVSISSFPHRAKKVKVSKTQIRIGLGQVFIFSDEGVGIDPNSLKIRYRVALDGRVQSYTLAKCRFSPRYQRFTCKTELVRPVEEWGVRTIRVDLDSIALADKAGNKLVLNKAEDWETLSRGNQLSFEFPPQAPKSLPAQYDLKKNTLY